MTTVFIHLDRSWISSDRPRWRHPRKAREKLQALNTNLRWRSSDLTASTQIPDLPLPHDPLAERALLGSIISGGEFPDVAATDFFLPFHAQLFRCLLRMKSQGKPTNDVVLIHDELLQSSELEAVGGVGYLAGLMDGLHTKLNVSRYAESIHAKARLRKNMALCQVMGEKMAAANGDAVVVLQEVATLSAQLRLEVGQKGFLNFRTGADPALSLEDKVPWIATGLVARGSITELGAKIKIGKTTLTLAMVKAVLSGAAFLGEPTTKTPVVYLTEQPKVSFRTAMERADLLGRSDFIFLMHGETRGLPWPQIVAEAVRECQRNKAFLLVVDTLGQFAGLTGDKENNAGDALEAMRPIQEAASGGVGIILVRHERKGGGDVGDSGRGSSAFAGAVDIVLSLRKPTGNAGNNRREIRSLSRFSETPNNLVIELRDDGEYVAMGERCETTLKEAQDNIFRTAPSSEADAADLQAIAFGAEVSRQTVQRAIEALVQQGRLSRIGEGKRGSPYKYFKPEMRICPTSTQGQDRKPTPERLEPSDREDRRDPN
jgi:hypothetical protein